MAKVKAKGDDERAPGSADSLEASPQMGSGVRDIKEEEEMCRKRGRPWVMVVTITSQLA